MTLRRQQDLLARLYTDSQFREEFCSNPGISGESYGLSAAESNEIAEVPAEQLNHFANSLIAKRLQEVEKLLPRTRESLGDEFGPLFRAFSREFVPNSIKKHLEDAFEFSTWLVRRVESKPVRRVIKNERAALRFFGLRRSLVLSLYAGRPFVLVRIGRRELIF